MPNKLAKKVLLIGWDAADWKVINPLLDAGMMPALESMINNGVMGNLATLDPPLSPMLWTSISTGKHADQHGILGFTEPAPEGKGIRPSMITSRKVKAIWNMLSQSGLTTNVVGWWPSHPAEPINGISISNFYQRATKDYGKEWPIADGTVHPKFKEEIFKNLRVHPGELTEAHILPFIPDAAKIDQKKDKKLSSLAKITADCSTIHAATTYILENEPWDFTAVYYDAIDHYCHGFMKYHPPKMDKVSKEEFDLYKGVVEGGYIYHDMMLSRLLQLAGEDATVILISDHGFHSDHLRPKGLPDEPAGPAWEHRNYGIFVMKGPGIKQDERIYGAGLLDIAPTILTLLGLPIGRDMEGKPLIQSFYQIPEPQYIDSWEEVEGDCGMHPADAQRDPIAEQAAMQQLIELGYIDKPEENVNKQIEKTVNESRFYLARVLMNKGNYSEALPIIEELYEKNQTTVRYAYRYAKCLDNLGRINESSEIVEKIIHYEENIKPIDDAKKIKEIITHLEKKLKEEKENIKSNKDEDDKAKQRKKILEEQIERRKRQQEKLKQEGKREYAHLFLLKGTLEYSKKNYKTALEFLDKAFKSDPKLPQLHQQLGFTYLKMRRREDAEQAFFKALENDPENPQAHLGLAQVYFRKREYEQSAEYSLNAVGLLYHFPRAHVMLGMALAKLKMYDRAIEAFKVALKMAPGLIAAHRYLAYIYDIQLKDKENADIHLDAIKKLQKNFEEKK